MSAAPRHNDGLMEPEQAGSWLDEPFDQAGAPEGDWLDEAFNDSKASEELAEARRSNRMGCLLLAVLLIAVIGIGICLFGFVGALSSVNATI